MVPLRHRGMAAHELSCEQPAILGTPGPVFTMLTLSLFTGVSLGRAAEAQQAARQESWEVHAEACTRLESDKAALQAELQQVRRARRLQHVVAHTGPAMQA